MSFQWSFSTDKLIRRCQRQFYFREIAGNSRAKEAWRREAFILKQLKTLELWRGTLIHEGIEKFLVPSLKNGDSIPWERIIEKTLQRATEQLVFSEKRRYREEGIAKGKHDDFCALVPHETGEGVSPEVFCKVTSEVEAAFHRMAEMGDLWSKFGAGCLWEAEVPIWVKFGEISIKVQIDLLLERSIREFTIIDWKSYEVGGDTDARLQTLLYAWALTRSEKYKVRSPESIELIECQVLDGTTIYHECNQELFDELEDHIYRSTQRIFTLCQSKKLADTELSDFAYTDNPNNCEYCSFRNLCVSMSAGASPTLPTGIVTSPIETPFQLT